MEDKLLDLDTKSLDHHGLIAAVLKDTDFIRRVDEILPKKSPNQKISHGEALASMIIQGLGFSDQRLYSARRFFSGLDTASLFFENTDASAFSADVLAGALDRVYEYGAEKLILDVCLKILTSKGLIRKLAYIDTTSVSVKGKGYRKRSNLLRHGHSKDKRPDLLQVVVAMATTSDGLPFWSKTYSGNKEDGSIFREIGSVEAGPLYESLAGRTTVLDSSMYSKRFFEECSWPGKWISRVPESIKLCRLALCDKSLKWTKVDSYFKIAEITRAYGGEEQRWIVVRSLKAKHAEWKTLDAKMEKQEAALKKACFKIEKRIFETKDDAKLEIEAQRKLYPYFKIDHYIIGHHKITRGGKRVKVGVKIRPKFSRNEKKIESLRMRKGKFILATNELNQESLNAEDILSAYKDRNRCIEDNFKFLKRKDLGLGQIHLKKDSRIEAALAVMTLIVFFNNLAQQRLRGFLSETGSAILNQKRRATQRPTMRWACQILRGVTKSVINLSGKIHARVSALTKCQETIVRAFGADAISLYQI